MLQTFTFLCTWPVDCAWLEEYPFSMSKNSRLTFWDSISLGNELLYSRYSDGTIHHARRLLIQGFQGRILKVWRTVKKIDKNVAADVAVFITAAEEYLAAEIVEKAAVLCRQKGKGVIGAAEITEAIKADNELKGLLC
ncbi:hypothetical protein AVEN_13740-1 [Araneus ventricosus]|uniref:Uncharacterized protein n=1 Tax=Araneus ventricosus TaxID=182803 RepID=A0A4Y2LMF7_ARAVE|nr:hypothetical protein AVEN_13740-1 [Araneus ventricosus]